MRPWASIKRVGYVYIKDPRHTRYELGPDVKMSYIKLYQYITKDTVNTNKG
jgi:hypothetical protein